MGTAAQDVTDVHAKRTNVGTSLAADPEDAHITLLIVVEQLALIDGADTQFLLHCRDQGWSLEHGSSQLQQGLLDLLNLVNVLMELDDCDVLFTSGLLGLNEAGGVVDACDEAACDLGVQGA